MLYMRGDEMAINKKTHMIISVVIPVYIEKELTKKAKVNNRSRSSQMLTYIQNGLKEDHKNSTCRESSN